MKEELEKTEPPTPHKIEEAYQRGIVPKSREITGLVILISIIVFLWFSGQSIVENFAEGVGLISAKEVSSSLIGQIFSIIVKLIFPILLISAIFAIVGNIIQSGFVLSPKAFEARMEKFNPAENISRIFSVRSLVEFSKSVIKASVVLGVMFLILFLSRDVVDEYFGIDMGSVLPKSASVVFKISMLVLSFFAILSVADYLFQRWDWWKSLMMTRSELREEMRRYEGDPQVRGRLRRRMFEMARTRMMAEVPRADVVITNPTHIAVALKYERGKMKAPKVVAKGMNLIAEKIIEIARNHSVPIYEDPPLAWALYRSTEIGGYIPEDLYKAVAKVLAYIMMLKQKQGRSQA